MSEIYDDWSNEDSLGGNWWENQSPEEIDDTKFTVLVQGHEHGLGPEAVQRAGIIAAGFDVEFIHWPEEVGKSDLGRGAILLALHPDKDILHYFPGGEHNYLRYQTDEGDVLRISCAQAILDLMEYSGIPKVDRPTIGKSEAEDIELQNNLLEEKIEHYYESLERDSKEPSIDDIVASETADLKWEDLLPPPDSMR